MFQLANVSLVTLDLLAQQTDLIQMLITILFQHGEMASKLKTTIPSFPIDHFIIILVRSFPRNTVTEPILCRSFISSKLLNGF